MPMEDVLFIAAQRIVQDSLLSEERQINLKANSIISSQNREIETLKGENGSLKIKGAMLETNYRASQENLMECGQKNERLKSREKVYIVGAAVAVGIIILKTLAP